MNPLPHELADAIRRLHARAGLGYLEVECRWPRSAHEYQVTITRPAEDGDRGAEWNHEGTWREVLREIHRLMRLGCPLALDSYWRNVLGRDAGRRVA